MGQKARKREHRGVKGVKDMQTKNEEVTAGWRESHGDSATPCTCADPAKVSHLSQVRHSCWLSVHCSFQQKRQCSRLLPVLNASVDSLFLLERSCFLVEEPGHFEESDRAYPKPRGWAARGERGGDETTSGGCKPDHPWRTQATTQWKERGVYRVRPPWI